MSPICGFAFLFWMWFCVSFFDVVLRFFFWRVYMYMYTVDVYFCQCSFHSLYYSEWKSANLHPRLVSSCPLRLSIMSTLNGSTPDGIISLVGICLICIRSHGGHVQCLYSRPWSHTCTYCTVCRWVTYMMTKEVSGAGSLSLCYMCSYKLWSHSNILVSTPVHVHVCSQTNGHSEYISGSEWL